MTDDPTTQDLDDAERAMQTYADELRRLSPSRMTPEQQSMYCDRMRSAEHRARYRRTGMTYREMSRLKEAKACRRVMPTEYSFDDNWMLIAEGTRRLGKIRQVVIHAVLRYPWLTLLVSCWLALYGLAKLCIWILLHF